MIPVELLSMIGRGSFEKNPANVALLSVMVTAPMNMQIGMRSLIA